MAQLVVPVSECDHILGSRSATVTLLEYGNYESPRCKEVHHTIKTIQKRDDRSFCFVFRHFPLTAIHPMAQHAAETAEAAAAQGYFWEVHDYLFEQQHYRGNGKLLRFAASLGLDVDRFEREVAEHLYVPKIQADRESGIASGVNGIPTFFINRDRYNGSLTNEALLAAIEQVGQ
ncbi:DsbA family protein [Oscillatoria sp. FACHB-1407]|uniref:DsbA family protein n=1 Tax=Oscillatoria sp. FACHB-1407 TaxID=2692847 RepID=UPI0018EFB974|nr:thioredoxin domain-containing protein [Oscillatoria sp. FACHB-1407]